MVTPARMPSGQRSHDVERGSEPTAPATDPPSREIVPKIKRAASKSYSFAKRQLKSKRALLQFYWRKLKNKEDGQPSSKAGCTIYRVSHRQRRLKGTAYEPRVISIGPYHHNKPHLKNMEAIKKGCLDLGTNPRKFIEAMQALEKQVRECYEGPISHRDNFLNIMLFDGCFVVSLIRNKYPQKFSSLGTEVWYDLLLQENQLPFLLLLKLDCMIMGNDADDFARAALSSFQGQLNGSNVWFATGSSPAQDIKHLLDLVHNCCRPSDEGIRQHQEFIGEEKRKSDGSWKHIGSATELDDAGISFLGEKLLQDQAQGEGMKSLLDITFTRGTKRLKIPTLCVDDDTERLLHNFLSCEQRTQNGGPTYVSDYVVFMTDLIKTEDNVKLLCDNGIIDNHLEHGGAVAKMFKELSRFSCSSESNFYYAETVVRVNRHCKRKWNRHKCKRKWDKHKKKLMNEYFNSPWSISSFLAATVLLLLTLLQTIYTVLSYYHRK